MFKNLIFTSILGLLTIILGAFGAHALKESLTFEQLQSYQTAVRYQMFHVLVLLFINTYDGFTKKQKNTISLIFFLGIFFFSGSIFAIQLTSLNAKNIWFITPLGGLLFIIGWCILGISFFKKIKKEEKKQ